MIILHAFRDGKSQIQLRKKGYGIKLWPDTLAEVQTKAPEAKHLEGL